MSKSNPVHLWRFGRTRTLIFTQKWLNRAKIGVLHGTPKNFLRPNKSVSRVFKTQLSKINWKIKSISSGLVTRRLYFLKKYDTKWAFFPPCRNWPMCGKGFSGAAVRANVKRFKCSLLESAAGELLLRILLASFLTIHILGDLLLIIQHHPNPKQRSF